MNKLIKRMVVLLVVLCLSCGMLTAYAVNTSSRKHEGEVLSDANGTKVFVDGKLITSGKMGENTRVIFDFTDGINEDVFMKLFIRRGDDSNLIVTPKSVTTDTPNGYRVVFDSGRYYVDSAYENTLWCSSIVTPAKNHYVITRGVNGLGATLYTSGKVYSTDTATASYGYTSYIDYRHYSNVIQRSNWGGVY